MTPQEFKDRYVEGIREAFKDAPDEVRAGLELKYKEFETLPRELLEESELSRADQDFLSRVGLPKSAAPSLNFQNLYERFPDFESHPFFKDYFLLGTASGQRLMGIDKELGDVVCIDLSTEDVELLFVNNSLEQFAECLCLFQEYRDRNELELCVEAMRAVDSRLAEHYSLWEDETENFLDNVVNSLNEAARKSRP